MASVGPQRHRGEKCANSGKIFTVQRKIVRNMAGAQLRAPCRSLFKQLETPPVVCLYIFSLVDFIIDNQENFQKNFSIYNITTRNKHHLDRPNANLSFFSKRYILRWHKTFQHFTTQCDNLQAWQGKI